MTQNDLNIRILADLRDFKTQLKDLETSTRAAASGVEGAFSGVGANLAKFGLAVSGVKQALEMIAAPIVGIVQTGASFETLQTRLESLYGSADRGREVFAALAEVAATTPFSLEDIVSAGVTLKSFGVDAEKTTKAVADLAAFMGTTATEAASALGRAYAGGAGAADILRERGVLELIKSFTGVQDLTKLTLPQFRDALVKAMQDPAAGIAGSTEKLSKTFSGALSNMMDSVDQLKAALSKDLNLNLKAIFLGVTEFATGLKDNLGPVLHTVGVSIKVMASLLAGAAAGFVALKLSTLGMDGILLTFMYSVDAVTASLKAMQVWLLTNPWTALATVVAAAGTAIFLFSTTQEDSVGPTEDATDALVAQADALRAVNNEKALFAGAITKFRNQQLQQDKETREFAKTLDGLTREQALAKLGTLDTIAAKGEDVAATIRQIAAINAYVKALDEKAKKDKGGPKTAEQIAAEKAALKVITDFAARRRAISADQAKDDMDRQKKAAEDSVRQYQEDGEKWLKAHEDRDDKTLQAAKERYQKQLTDMTAIVRTFSDGIGNAMAEGWTSGLAGLRGALKQMVLTILDAVQMMVLEAKIATLAKALLAAGWNLGAGLAALSASLPEIIGLEALFAGLRVGVQRMEVGSGPITRPTMALLGEAYGRSGGEMVVPEVPFVKWANQVLLPKVAGGVDRRSHDLLSGIRDGVARVERAIDGRKIGRAIGHELATSGRAGL